MKCRLKKILAKEKKKKTQNIEMQPANKLALRRFMCVSGQLLAVQDICRRGQ